jgi:hypothetical protein
MAQKEATKEDLATALTLVEVVVQTMADAGIDPIARTTALAMHMRDQVLIGAGSKERANAMMAHLTKRFS